jgi:hypothetical protein
MQRSSEIPDQELNPIPVTQIKSQSTPDRRPAAANTKLSNPSTSAINLDPTYSMWCDDVNRCCNDKIQRKKN